MFLSPWLAVFHNLGLWMLPLEDTSKSTCIRPMYLFDMDTHLFDLEWFPLYESACAACR
jgi:hypothetical protein